MKTLLQLNTSLFSGQGQSTQLANQFVARWRDKNLDGRVITRDLAADPAPHLDGARFANALAALDVAPADLTWRAGIDLLSPAGATESPCDGTHCMRGCNSAIRCVPPP